MIDRKSRSVNRLAGVTVVGVPAREVRRREKSEDGGVRTEN
jgi:hypothetical protein